MGPVIGVLALQGDFSAHRNALEQSGAQALEVRSAGQVDAVDGLIIPGGESTTMLRLLGVEHLFEKLQEFGQRKPIFGTCAGAILMASEVLHPAQASLGLLDITVQRNGYGRQLDSHIAPVNINGESAEAVFIRAPIIRRVGPSISVLATSGDNPVLVQNGRLLASTFHPELSRGSSVHKYFVKMVETAAQSSKT